MADDDAPRATLHAYAGGRRAPSRLPVRHASAICARLAAMLRAIPLLLVVDDDVATAQLLTRWLGQQGYNAVAAASCLEARAIVDAVSVDGMLGHLALPDGSLFEIAQTLRSRPTGRPPGAPPSVNASQANVPVLIGYADVDVRPPPELDACFVRPLDLVVLGRFLDSRFRRRRSGELLRISTTHSVPAATVTSLHKSATRKR